MEDELDFFSLAFNPLRALSAPGLRPPVANARPLDNLHQCRRLLPPDHPSYLPPRDTAATTDLASLGDKDRSKQRLSYVQQKRDRETQVCARWLRLNPLEEMMSQFKDGPLSKVREWYNSRREVRVVTRHDRGVRGIAIGTLVAFDKHLNVVLKDAEETYTVLLQVQRETKSGGMRWCRRQERRQRKMKQVFIAGNSVVMLSAAAKT